MGNAVLNEASKSNLLEPEFLRKLERLAIAAKRIKAGSSLGERRSKKKGSSVEFADYRGYAQGDDLRHVDWNVYARLDSLYLKLFEAQEDRTLHILIDASRSMAFGAPPKIQFAKRLAAAIGYVGLVGYDRVSVEAFAGERKFSLRPCRGKESSIKMFSFIESIAADGVVKLEPACRSYLKRNRTSGVTLLISDFMDSDGADGFLRRLVLSGSEVFAIMVLAPEEIDPQLSGDLKLVDCETGETTEISVGEALLKKYKSRLDEFRETARKSCLSRGISFYSTSSDTPLESLTLDILRKGGMLK